MDILRIYTDNSWEQLTETGWTKHSSTEVVALNAPIAEVFDTEFLLVQNAIAPTVRIISDMQQALKGETNG